MYKLTPLHERGADWFANQLKKHLYLSYNWLKAIAESYDFECFLLLDEQEALVNAFCKVNDMMGKRLVSLPFSDYIPVAENSLNFEELRNLCNREFPEYKLILKTDLAESPSETFRCIKNAVYHRIDTSSTDWPKRSKSFKRGVKQAQKNALEVRFEYSRRALKDFYRLYHRLRFDKFNIIPQPFTFFEALWETFIHTHQGVIIEATHNQEVIASMIVLYFNHTAYYKYGCSALEHLDLKPNNLLFHELIAHCIKHNFHSIDLGLSGSGEAYAGLRRWKSSIGGEEKPITYWSHNPVNLAENLQLITQNKEKISKLTDAIIKAELNPKQTSLLSEQIYPLLA